MSPFYLHGMGGSPLDWNEVRKILPGKAIELPGENSFSEIIHKLAVEIQDEKKITLVGYSLGGRIAILLAAELLRLGNAPESLVLLGAGLGFSSASERAERQAIDEKWAQMAEANSDIFWDEWYRQPLFASFFHLPIEQRATWLKNRKSINISILSAQLRFLGPAAHEDLFPILAQIKRAGISVLYLAGELDKKYLNLGQKLRNELGLALGIIPGAGHILPLEAPALVAEQLKTFASAK